jgi:predicted nucleotidyltransferase component of viral defense system
MISTQQLKAISRKTGLSLYQQEMDYFLKLFLYNYFRKNGDAVFKGGTCMRFLFGFDRFSEDLDFNLARPPREFKAQVGKVVKEFGFIGIDAHFIKEEQFEDAYTCEIGFNGPLYKGTAQTRNRIRIDAGRRTGTLRDPEWRLVSSEYPETREQFLVLTMNDEEMLVEKAIALMERRKGRDLYDVWFMLKKGVRVDKELFDKKSRSKFQFHLLVSKEEYERDMKRLTNIVIPYLQIAREVKESLSALS